MMLTDRHHGPGAVISPLQHGYVGWEGDLGDVRDHTQRRIDSKSARCLSSRSRATGALGRTRRQGTTRPGLDARHANVRASGAAHLQSESAESAGLPRCSAPT